MMGSTASAPGHALLVRPADPADEPAIRALFFRASPTPVTDWPWAQHLGEAGFLLALLHGRVVGALLAWADEGPVAWVRMSMLEEGFGVGRWLDQSLPLLAEALCHQGATTLAWADGFEWVGPALRERGFRPLTRLITMIKDSSWLPPLRTDTARLRAATTADAPALVCLDHAAFPPPWWLGRATLERLSRESACFLVAERDGRCLGYVEGRLSRPGAHIGRLAVAPTEQGRGIGARLLSAALSRLAALGATQVTLNTQEENHASRRLYARFGFRPFGRRVTVWGHDL